MNVGWPCIIDVNLSRACFISNGKRVGNECPERFDLAFTRLSNALIGPLDFASLIIIVKFGAWHAFEIGG